MHTLRIVDSVAFLRSALCLNNGGIDGTQRAVTGFIPCSGLFLVDWRGGTSTNSHDSGRKVDGFLLALDVDGNEVNSSWTRSSLQARRNADSRSLLQVKDLIRFERNRPGPCGVRNLQTCQRVINKTCAKPCAKLLSRLKSLATIAVIADCTRNDHSTNSSKYFAYSRFYGFF